MSEIISQLPERSNHIKAYLNQRGQMLAADIRGLPIDMKLYAIADYDTAIRSGTLDLYPLLQRQVRTRLRDSRNSSIGLAMGGSVSVGLALAVLASALAGGVTGLSLLIMYGYTSAEKSKNDRVALRDGDFGHLVTHDEFKELIAIVGSFGQPANSKIAAGLERVKAMIKEECEFDPIDRPAFLGDDDEAIDTEASAVDDESPSTSVPASGERGDATLFSRLRAAIDSANPDHEEGEGGNDTGSASEAQQVAPPFIVNGKPDPAFLALPSGERAEILLHAFRTSGFHIWPYLNRATLAAGTQPRSGKTTLFVMMGILERALYGRELYFCTTSKHDAKTKYPVAWDGLAAGSTQDCLSGLMKFGDDVSKDEISSRTWILDELSRTLDDCEVDDEMRRKIWSVPLTCLAKRADETGGKSGEKMRAIVHGTTASMCGVPHGKSESFQNEIVLLRGKRVESHDGTQKPSGVYELWNGERGKGLEATGEYISIPSWLLEVDANPVLAILEFFPEQHAKNAGFEPKNIGIQKLENKPVIEGVGVDAIPFGGAQNFNFPAPKPPVVASVPVPAVAPSEGGETFEGAHDSVVMEDAAPRAAQVNPKDPIVKGTRYKRSELLAKVKGFMSKEPDRAEFSIDYLARKFHSKDKGGARDFMRSLFAYLAKTKPARYDYADRTLILKSRVREDVKTEG